MKTADFDFSLPKDLIALRPSEQRDHSRLLVLHRDGTVEHRRFFDIFEYLNKGDMLLMNNTKVFPARITGTKPSGGKIDILLVKEIEERGTWEVLCRGNYSGKILISEAVEAGIWTVHDKDSENGLPEKQPKKLLRFLNIEPSGLGDILWRCGHMPLPPYIKRMPDNEDKQRYQTVYAENQGSIAAPTAGLHFTEDLLNKIREKGILARTLTLHVGVGTFKPIKAESLEDHRMDLEYFEIKSSLLDEIDRVRRAGHRLITVGTTTTRAIEGFMSGLYENGQGARGKGQENGSVQGYTDIFISPGYAFKTVDSLVTNFHLPCSTPLMLASAFCGFERLLKAYEEAIAMGYRFFSYGDAMLIV